MILGDSLRDAYSGTLARIKAQGGSESRLGMDMLMWLSHSQRPLNTNELCDALGVEIESTDRNSQNIPAIETLLGCSFGLIEVEANTNTVRLVHSTLQEHLLNDPDLFHSSHATIAQVCLTYLNFQCIRDLPPFSGRPPPETPLLEYASWYWGIHARRGITKSVNALALRLLDGFDKHVSSGILLSYSRDNWSDVLGRSNPVGFTGLHGAAYLGMVEAAVALLKMKKWDLGTTDVTGNTALSWAARRGHEAMVGMLLAQEDVTPDTTDRDGRTPLLWAARNRHRGIVKMLLDREDVSPNTADEDGLTPFSWEVINGHEDVVKTLLGREGVTPGAADKNGQTPLHRAVINKRADIVKMLLELEDVSPNTADKYGQTPLHRAVIDKSADIVKALLERQDLSPNTTDKDGQTPLQRAVRDAHTDIVKLLLERKDVTPHTTDISGRSTLSWVAGNGNDDLVKVLLERGDVILDAEDKNGRTPLSWAAGNGHGGIVKMLLENEGVTPDTADKSGRTALSWAAGNGCGDVVRILLVQEGVIPDTADKDGRTPLSWAAGSEHDDIVKMFLERGLRDAERGHVGEMGMFLALGSINQGMPITETAGQAELPQTSEKQPGGVIHQPSGDQESLPQSAVSNSPIDLVSAPPSESSNALPTGSGNLEIHDKNSSNKRSLCCVIRNFFLCGRGRERTQNLPPKPEQNKKKYQTSLKEATPKP